MHFGTENYLKNNHNYTAKHSGKAAFGHHVRSHAPPNPEVHPTR